MTSFSKKLVVKNAQFVQADESNLETLVSTSEGLLFLNSVGAVDTIFSLFFF